MAPILYMLDVSPPVRSVLLTAKALHVNLEHKIIDVTKGEQLDPEFIKINPQHSIPTLVDDNLVICDSHAINAYLVRKFSKNDDFYPKDLTKRAMVDQRLYFDTGMVFPLLIQIAYPIKSKKTKVVPQECKEKALEIYSLLEGFLKTSEWMAGNFVSIADFSLVTSVTALETFVPISPQNYANVVAWIKRCETWPFYDQNSVGLAKFKTFFSQLMSA